jgi:hypothetical protein
MKTVNFRSISLLIFRTISILILIFYLIHFIERNLLSSRDIFSWNTWRFLVLFYAPGILLNSIVFIGFYWYDRNKLKIFDYCIFTILMLGVLWFQPTAI